ncbi:hypothetical protein SAMN02745166_02390 [Prosthecobacter debontii]|uniref:DUF2281 domain-containing protein n=1 Tax=Prosthecobacter debontii TaxID=48467 RepID=A0A1T4Y547_9BACT|nr:DUF2281 domain-containing protein [Prosthecobacter debontii]SKA96415.1 hypothetical protein SAMN02745166_02390 [Prosthecobacter debontii]
MSTLAEIELAAAKLPASDKESLMVWLQFELEAEKKAVPGQRVSGLGKGAWSVANDFNDPLPDEFWLGEDA